MNFNIAEVNNLNSTSRVSTNNNSANLQLIDDAQVISYEIAEAIEVSEMILDEESFEQEEKDFTDKVVHYMLHPNRKHVLNTGESGGSSFLYFVKIFVRSVVGFFNNKKHKKRKKWLEKRKSKKKK